MILDRPSLATRHRSGATARLRAAVRRALLPAVLSMCALAAVGAVTAQGRGHRVRHARAPLIGAFQPNPPSIASTVPANGDVNPYGIVQVPRSIGSLRRGDLLISNFNDKANNQGTGTTLVQIPPTGNGGMSGTASLFAQIDPTMLPGACPGGVGLTTALAVTRTGYVIVGSLPTTDGTSATAQAGCLLVLDPTGHVVSTISGDPINGPWDMTAVERGRTTTLYVTNVLNGTVAASPDPTKPGNVVNNGTVVRIRLLTLPRRTPTVLSETVIGTGFPERTDPDALVVGPTGVALSKSGTLYVADTQGNRIAAIPGASFRRTPIANGGMTVTSAGFLNNPLGMTLAPNGDILTANAGDGNIVETTPSGAQADIAADGPGGGGVLFGLTTVPQSSGVSHRPRGVSPRSNGVSARHTSVYFVDDGDNTLRVLKPTTTRTKPGGHHHRSGGHKAGHH